MRILRTEGPIARTLVQTSSDADNCLTICCWNINGLSDDKLMDDVLGNKLKIYDFILLLETWARKCDLFEIEGYDFYNYPRNHRHQNARGASGGLGIFVRVSLNHRRDVLHNHSDLITWIILWKDFFDLEHGLYVTNVYFPPEWPAHSSEEPVLKCDIANLLHECFVLTCEDFNARTQSLCDYSTEGSGWGSHNVYST